MVNNNCCPEGSQGIILETKKSIYQDTGEFPWVNGLIDTPVGRIRRVKTVLEPSDRRANKQVMIGFGRDNYLISPGLYAIGDPGDKSPVLVTANYKLTFDTLRRELTGQNLWVLVLNTEGINVWCAAGKGTFGTAELINRIKGVDLSKVVSHHNLILPQLGAPGVAALEVRKVTGFKVSYGPIKAKDIPAYLQNNCHAHRKMRTVRFDLPDRIAAVPVEISHSVKYMPFIFLFLLLINFISPGLVGLSGFGDVVMISLFNMIPYLLAVILGTFGMAALLPYIPFRSFALKGALLGLVLASLVFLNYEFFRLPDSQVLLTAHCLIIVAITAFLGLNFTGSTTYTSLSGVQKETLYSIPVILLAALAGIVILVTEKVRLFL